MDDNGTGLLEFEDFLDMMSPWISSNHSKEDLEWIFKIFDYDWTNEISIENLK